MVKGQSLQDPFLNALRQECVPVSIYLTNGIKLQGQVESFDQFVILLKSMVSQMIYKHVISAVVPSCPVPHYNNNAGGGSSNYHHGGNAQGSSAPQQDSDGAEQGQCYFSAPGNQVFCVPRRYFIRGLRLFDRYDAGEQAVLVHIYFSRDKDMEDLQGFETLASFAGVKAVQVITGNRKAPHPKYFIGEDKAVEITKAVKATGASAVPFGHALSPAQERNLGRLCGCWVIDRTDLILGIFAQCTRTHEGKLQVELAQLRHMTTHLVRGWAHLERQKGEIGLHDPGKTQLGTDRRLLRNRIIQILSRLERVEKQCERGRRSHVKADIPAVSLMGYTNAGKSTLFNQITAAEVHAVNQLSATLDPTLRRINVPDVDKTVLADTVGFIRHLPRDLVAALEATLQETRQATLLLHMIGVADIHVQENIDAVNAILAEIEAGEIPALMVMNEIDMLNDFEPRIDRNDENKPIRVWLSAQTGVGISLLFQALTKRLSGEMAQHTLRSPPKEGQLGSRFYQLQAVEKR